jgi:hypothetical protein
MKRILVQAGHKRPLQPSHERETGTAGRRSFAAFRLAVLPTVVLGLLVVLTNSALAQCVDPLRDGSFEAQQTAT